MKTITTSLLGVAAFVLVSAVSAPEAAAQRGFIGLDAGFLKIGVNVGGHDQHCHGPSCRRGYYTTVRRRYQIPGCHESVRIPAVYRTRYRCGRSYRYCVRRARTVRRWVPARWAYRNERVYRTGWSCGY